MGLSGDPPRATDLVASTGLSDRAMDTDPVAATRRVLDLRRKPAVADPELDAACGLLSGVIAQAESADGLRRALDLDSDVLLLPPELKSQAYERLLELDGRAPETLREYAWHLRIHGPDWDEKADALDSEAEGSPE